MQSAPSTPWYWTFTIAIVLLLGWRPQRDAFYVEDPTAASGRSRDVVQRCVIALYILLLGVASLRGAS